MSDTPRIYTPGAFVWHEHVSHDTAGAQRFYAELFGWTMTSQPSNDGPAYAEIHVGDRAIGGFFQCDAPPAPAFWFGYVSVPDVDAAVARAQAAGGRLVAGPKDIPHVGRFAMIQDPQGASFAVYRGLDGDPSMNQMPAPGEFCWDSLTTPDGAASAAFYATVVGWRAGDDSAGAGAVFYMGELMEASYGPAADGSAPHWLAHAVVPNLEEATAKVEALGGKVLTAPIEIPYGRYLKVQDPLGAVLALFETKPFDGTT